MAYDPFWPIRLLVANKAV